MIAARLLRSAVLTLAALLPAALAQAQPATYYAGVVQHPPTSIPATQVVARYTLPRMSGGVNDFSGIATRDGVNIIMVSDHGYLVRGRLQRGYGQSIDGMELRQFVPLLDENGQPLGAGMRDAEGVSIGRDGAIYVAFEEHNRVLRYARAGGPAQDLGVHRDFSRLRAGRGLESVAVAPDGRVYSIPERAARATYGFPSYVWRNGAGWDGAFRLPSDGQFLPVGADFGPDGRLYVLEREYSARGYRSQVRRFSVNGQGISEGQWVMRSEVGQFGNLEGLAVFRDWGGRIRLLMVSDDDRGRGPSELIDVVVNR
ncbi:esterase-like activity of phytase family protein [Pararhodobacter sp. CCB-MM2]|uniref:esterase-like activity of phytase family protein n=1 Tax=Pararhodobacter sp. CCB-MM2 TaxID=1786003 RepID=UPI0008366C87|nr:esterase-like activity of phytase family protein [Pararhodobacter sp. CCB-MM2]